MEGMHLTRPEVRDAVCLGTVTDSVSCIRLAGLGRNTTFCLLFTVIFIEVVKNSPIASLQLSPVSSFTQGMLQAQIGTPNPVLLEP